eukprot:scaffold22268_cov57-Phaeocystis_antarctica.AAC.2
MHAIGGVPARPLQKREQHGCGGEPGHGRRKLLWNAMYLRVAAAAWDLRYALPVGAHHLRRRHHLLELVPHTPCVLVPPAVWISDVAPETTHVLVPVGAW